MGIKKEGNKKKSGFIVAVFLICLITLAFSGYQLASIFLENFRNSQEIKAFQQFTITTQPEEKQGKTQREAGFTVNFKGLTAKNKDVVGWIRLPGKALDYPVAQGENNEYYLSHTASGQENRAGSIFLDYRNDNAMNDGNTVIYGHRMNDGSMFAELLHYGEQAYCDAHPVLLLFTPERNYRLEVFAAEEADESQDFVVKNFVTEAQFYQYIEERKAASKISTGVALDFGDQCVTLSTCVQNNGEKRFVVSCKLVVAET